MISAGICLSIGLLVSLHSPVLGIGSAVVTTPNHLGTHHHPITTSSPQAQKDFDRGLILAFAFNHAEAWEAFEKATQSDRNCAMCYWGMALVLGPNINTPMDAQAVEPAYETIQKALQLAEGTSDAEQDYMSALAIRYTPEAKDDRAALDLAYAHAMEALSQRYPEDVDAATLFAEALMNTMPWDYWMQDGQPKPETQKILTALESVLDREPTHPGANHYYIHAVEAVNPYKAESAADRLRDLNLDAGHLVHMPSHIYVRIGRYHDATVVNERAIDIDEAYIAREKPKGIYPGLYYPHNIHFLWFGASMEGRSQVALDAARKLVAQVSPEAVRAAPFLEQFLPVPLFTLVQFGQWEAILDEPQPPSEFFYSTAMWHYARGLALARLEHLDEARTEATGLAATIDTGELIDDAVPFASLVQIADTLLRGEVAGLEGKSSQMLQEFQTAVELQDSIPYMEPPFWYYPTRHTLGAALLEEGRASEAETIYREDLAQNPENGRSLFGLAQSLESQGAMEEAAAVRQRFEIAWAHADIELRVSRF
ncbi:tetratricopeptide repeat protein [Oscillatoriales cyanobacterium LEGE 11467]|uniref:Tetratricopeptide repeat protein n=1 Tax=Zarconia navalis LEGE 11467 TaxID=1828826 RepID=A0A928VYD6_9CYAN|nr:tetratricopeptide repeat protein [Zarconia navalis LEGE 11467]